MSLQMQHLFEFGEFRLDVAEKALLRDGVAISVTPKVFDTLQVLVENAGRLVEKDELMRRIWQDRFVEESNLSFNIKMLRKALGDDAANPRFVETVPRRGYRFVAEVSEKTRENVPLVESVQTKSANDTTAPGRREGIRVRKLLLPAFAVIGLGVIVSGLWLAGAGGHGPEPPILSADFRTENLSTNGSVFGAVISPDGKNVVYTNGLSRENQSVWLRQLDSSNNVQIIPPSEEAYGDMAFSPDGNFLYFIRGAKPSNFPGQYAIYRISIFGGIASKLVDGVQGDIGISPDGGRISFVRCSYRDDEWCSLWIADSADGRNERKLVSRPSPFRIGDSSISPDGRTVAFGVGQSRNGRNDFSLAAVDIESGVERELAREKFFNIVSQVWLPDQQSLLITALKLPDKHFRIWQVSAITGESSVRTKISEDYLRLSIDKNADQLVATKRRQDFHLRLYRAKEMGFVRQIFADATTVEYSPDGRLLVASGQPSSADLWSVSSEGKTERQLTNTPGDDQHAVPSPDGSSIYFTSNRTGEAHIWKMKSDGSDQERVTTGDGGSPLRISPDGKWLYYHSALGRTLRRVSVDDGREELIVDKLMPIYAVSSDCFQAAYIERQGNETTLMVATLPDGRSLKSFKLAAKEAQVSAIEWSGDGKSFFYVLAAGVDDAGSVWMQSLGEQVPRKIGDLVGDGLRNESSFALSPDGKSFALIQGNWKRDAVMIRGLK